MKKTLVTLLALVFVLSIASAAFAAPANPFVDVPAKHWAYAAVSQLAAAGIVDGYGDGTFKGDKTITRYEMAQMVAKAMAKSDKADAEQKALIDKLAVEFAAELNNLGVRVAKLEAGASSIKFSGDFRFRYVHYNSDASELQTRLRLSMASQINDNTSFSGSLIAQNYTRDLASSEVMGVGDVNTAINIETASFTTKDVAGMDLTVGRNYVHLGQGWIMDAPGFDGALVSFGKDLKVTLGYGDIAFAPSLTEGAPVSKDTKMVTVANLSYAVNPNFNLTAAAMYANSNTPNWTDTNGPGGYFYAPPKFQAFGFNWKANSDWGLVGEFARNSNADDNNTGWYTQVNYKGADGKVPGTWGMWLGYVKAEDYAIDEAITTLYYSSAGVKSVYGGVSYTLAKNVMALAEVRDEKYIDQSLGNRDMAYRLYLMYSF